MRRMDELDDDLALPRLTPAPLGPRIAAGVLDGVLTLVVGGVFFAVPFELGAYALPVWAVLAAILGCSVIPLAAFGSTLGMRIFGVELVGRDGKPPDLIELLFREIIARGMGPAAFVGSVVIGVIAALFRRAYLMNDPRSLGWGFYICVLLVMGAIGGHFVALGREDRRSFADLVGKTMVIPRALAAVHADADEDERAEARAARRLRTVTVLVAEAAIAFGIVGMPVLLSVRWHSSSEVVDHLKLEPLEQRFSADPANAALADELARAYRRQGAPAKAEAVPARNEAAVRAKANAQEASLRKRLAEAPADDDASFALVELLEDQDRVPEARTVREAAYRAQPGAESQASLGVWLYQHDFDADAVAALRGALDGGAELGEVHAYLGLALLELGQKPEARQELHRAQTLDPDLDGVQEKLDDLEDELGPEPAAKPPKRRR